MDFMLRIFVLKRVGLYDTGYVIVNLCGMHLAGKS